nr:hypothetical protein GCM10020241_63120 [Streptoalloteichus tenebrarius]
MLLPHPGHSTSTQENASEQRMSKQGQERARGFLGQNPDRNIGRRAERVRPKDGSRRRGWTGKNPNRMLREAVRGIQLPEGIAIWESAARLPPAAHREETPASPSFPVSHPS